MRNPVQSYIYQRVTALILVPLTLWFIFSIITLLQGKKALYTIVSSPLNLIATISFFAALAIHSIIGISSILKDYVHNKKLNIAITLFFYLFTILSTLIGIVSILYLHLYVKLK